MRKTDHYFPKGQQESVSKWVPEDSHKFVLDPRLQPYFKLHGSLDWRDGADNEMMIMGKNKDHNIKSHAVLRWYHERFAQHLLQPDASLMIIGYGFGDEHINNMILKATQNGLKIFIIDPNGLKATAQTNRTLGAPIYVPSPLEQAIDPIGISTRPLSETFNKDTLEHSNIMRFFD